jgi:hypothetical protein
MIDRRKLMNSFTQQEAFTKAVEKVARPETE